VWALWVIGGLAVWFLVAGFVAVLIGRGVRLADRREFAGRADAAPNFAVDTAAPQRAAGVRQRRRAVPLPPVGVALAAAAVLLETAGFLLRLRHTSGPAIRVLSMDAPLSLPRLYVAGLFAAAAAAAVIGAGTLPGRRSWWTGVGVVAGLIAAVKAGGTIHVALMDALDRAVGSAAAQVVSALLAVAVVSGLWVLSRNDRRDRRRVLGTLALYGVAAVGLSGISSLVGADSGSWALSAAATYVEESGEALAGVGFLVAVLIGVAPRLVLPRTWALRREADAYTLDVAEQAHRRPASGAAGRP
jgi:hypothetical protein